MKPMNYQDLASLLISTLKNQVRWNPATKNGKALAQKTWMSVRYTEVNGHLVSASPDLLLSK